MLRGVRRGMIPGEALRLALRALRHNPGFTIVVCGVLATGIAGSSFVYSVAEALLFRPIPYSEPESLYLVSTAYSTGGTQVSVIPTVAHWQLFEWLRDRQTLLEAVAAYSSRGANISGDGWGERLRVGSITRGFLPLTGVRPFPGRGFLESEFQPQHSHVALLTHSAWQRRFSGAPDAVGRTVVINDAPYTIVGVLPPDFRSVSELMTGLPTWFDDSLGALVPLVGDPTRRSRSDSSAGKTLFILGRVRQSRRLEAARQELALFSAGLPEPSGPMRSSYTLTPLAAALTPGVPERLALLAAAVGVLLLVACANGALLMLQRRESRRRETEIRAALGATPAQLAGEALVEAVLSGAVACAVGLAVAWGAIRVTRTLGGSVLTGLTSV